jgi:hypothetical protein
MALTSTACLVALVMYYMPSFIALLILAWFRLSLSPWFSELVQIFVRFKTFTIGLGRVPLHPELRKSFQRSFKLLTVPQPTRHSHRQAAQARTSVSRSMDAFISSMGALPFSVSMSPRDNQQGERLYYVPKDVIQAPSFRRPSKTQILKMIDVDYYADMEYWLAKGLPLMLYTFVPMTAGGPVPDGEFSILNDVVTYRITGGGHYVSRLWDYSHETITVPSHFGTYIYSIDQYSLADDNSRRVVLLTPEIFVYSPADWLLQSQPLQRQRFSYGSYNMVRTAGPVSLLSVSQPGVAHSISIKESLFLAIRQRYVESKWKQISDIERYLSANGVQEPSTYAALLFPILTVLDGAVPDTVVSPAPELGSVAPNYQTLAPLISEDGRPIGRIVAPPLLLTAVTPSRSLNNDTACVEHRITRVRNQTEPSIAFYGYASEFVEFLVPTPHVGTPVGLDFVHDKQGRPSQRLRSEQSRWTLGLSEFLIRSFQKAETYPKIDAPRNISTVPTDHTLMLSMFTYAFKQDVLMKLSWFAPARTPRQIVNDVMALASSAPFLTPTDISRLDGSLSEWIATHLENAAYLRWVAPQYRNELMTHLRKENGARAITRHGVRYDTGYSRVSGSPRTTDGNSLDVAFIDYAAGRMSGLAARTAWDSMGLTYGDDGLTRRTSDAYKAAARQIGITVKEAESRYPGQSVTFLARVFLDPWTTGDTIQDPLRTAPKLHISFANKSVPVNVAAFNRAVGYLVTDPVTPLISHWCRAVKRCTGDLSPDIGRHEMDLRADRRLVDDPNDSWPAPEFPTGQMWEAVAAALSMSTDEVAAYCSRLDAVTSMENFPPPLARLPLVVKVPAVLEGEILGKEEISDVPLADSGGSRSSSSSSSLIPNVQSPSSTPVQKRPVSQRPRVVHGAGKPPAVQTRDHKRRSAAHIKRSDRVHRPGATPKSTG